MNSSTSTIIASESSRKKCHSRSSDANSSSSENDSHKSKLKKKKRSFDRDSSPHRSHKRKKEKHSKKKSHKKKSKSKDKIHSSNTIKCKDDEDLFDVPLDLMDKSKSMAPMTKDEWEKRQSIVRRVYDETTGRHRLVKGDGEIIEEIVSKERHQAINAEATKGDGNYFQSVLHKK